MCTAFSRAGKNTVVVSVKDRGDHLLVAVKDTGHGISLETMERVARNELPGNKIGLLNVHHRVRLLYGEGLHIRRLEPGTEISFYIPRPDKQQPIIPQTPGARATMNASVIQSGESQ